MNGSRIRRDRGDRPLRWEDEPKVIWLGRPAKTPYRPISKLRIVLPNRQFDERRWPKCQKNPEKSVMTAPAGRQGLAVPGRWPKYLVLFDGDKKTMNYQQPPGGLPIPSRMS